MKKIITLTVLFLSLSIFGLSSCKKENSTPSTTNSTTTTNNTGNNCTSVQCYSTAKSTGNRCKNITTNCNGRCYQHK